MHSTKTLINTRTIKIPRRPRSVKANYCLKVHNAHSKLESSISEQTGTEADIARNLRSNEQEEIFCSKKSSESLAWIFVPCGDSAQN